MYVFWWLLMDFFILSVWPYILPYGVYALSTIRRHRCFRSIELLPEANIEALSKEPRLLFELYLREATNLVKPHAGCKAERTNTDVCMDNVSKKPKYRDDLPHFSQNRADACF